MVLRRRGAARRFRVLGSGFGVSGSSLGLGSAVLVFERGREFELLDLSERKADFRIQATMPWAAACGSCAKDAKTKLRQGRAGWFTCRTCEVFFPEAAVANCDGDALHARRQRCLNCASRGSWARGKSTCRKCGGVWSQPREQGDKRQRLCPKCRPKATSAKRL